MWAGASIGVCFGVRGQSADLLAVLLGEPTPDPVGFPDPQGERPAFHQDGTIGAYLLGAGDAGRCGGGPFPGGKKRELSMPLHAACSCHAQQSAPKPGSRDESAIPLVGSRSIGAIRDARSVTGPAPVRPWIAAVAVGIAVSPTPVRAPPATRASRRSKVVIALPSDVPDSIVPHRRTFREWWGRHQPLGPEHPSAVLYRATHG